MTAQKTTKKKTAKKKTAKKKTAKKKTAKKKTAKKKTAKRTKPRPREVYSRAIFFDGEVIWVLGEELCFPLEGPGPVFREYGFRDVMDSWTSDSGVTYLAGMNTALTYFNDGGWHALGIPLPDARARRAFFVGGVSGEAPIDDELFCLLGRGAYRPDQCTLCWRRDGVWSRFLLPDGVGTALAVAPDGTAFFSLGGTPARVGQTDPNLFRFQAGQLEQIDAPRPAAVQGLQLLDSGDLLLFHADDAETCSAWVGGPGRWSEVHAPSSIRGNHSGRVVCQNIGGETHVATQDGTLLFDVKTGSLQRKSSFKGLKLFRAGGTLICFGALDGSWAHEVLTDDGWEPLIIEEPDRDGKKHVKLDGVKTRVKQVRLRRAKKVQDPETVPSANRGWAKNADLEAAIVQEPLCPESYLVYGDWLQTRGDPRGDLITLMHAAIDRPEQQSRAVEASRAFETAFLGELTRFMEFSWHLGFVESLALIHRVGEFDYPELLSRALDHPALIFLRSFAFHFALRKNVRKETCAALISRLSARAETLTSVDLSGSVCFHHADDLRGLAPLERLTHLDLKETKLKRLDGLESLADLEVLELDYNPVKSIAPLAALSRLRKVSMRNLPITDLSALSDLSELEDLQLYYTRCADLAPLARLKKLKRLDIGGTDVVDLEPLAGLERLEYLNVLGLSVELSPLAGLPNLEQVHGA